MAEYVDGDPRLARATLTSYMLRGVGSILDDRARGWRKGVFLAHYAGDAMMDATRSAGRVHTWTLHPSYHMERRRAGPCLPRLSCSSLWFVLHHHHWVSALISF